MCLSCGCVYPEIEKGDDQITIDDLRRAADAQDTTVDEVVVNAAKASALAYDCSRQ